MWASWLLMKNERMRFSMESLPGQDAREINSLFATLGDTRRGPLSILTVVKGLIT